VTADQISDYNTVTAVKIVQTSGSINAYNSANPADCMVNFYLPVTVPPGTQNGQLANNTFMTKITVTGSGAKSYTESMPATIEIVNPDVGVTKTASKPAYQVGDTVIYTVTVTNNCKVPVTNVETKDFLPPAVNLTYVGCSVPAASFDALTNTLTVPLGAFQALGTESFTVTMLAVDLGKNLPNTAAVTMDEPDFNPDNDTATCMVSIVPPQVTLHIRQVLLTGDGQIALPPNLNAPAMGYMTLRGFNAAAPSVTLALMNITAVSTADVTPQQFSTYKLDMTVTGDQYRVTDIIPQYFHYVGYVLTTDLDTPHDATLLSNDTDTPLLDYSSGQTEYWLTIYLKPNTENPRDNETNQATNPFGTISMN
jgi:uncharacterized repeat protein (TIGR01451 family)